MHPRLKARRLEVQSQRHDALRHDVLTMLLAIERLAVEEDIACNDELEDVRAALSRVISPGGVSREELLDLAAKSKKLGNMLRTAALT